jgi:iron complex transport system substrate-binding protein
LAGESQKALARIHRVERRKMKICSFLPSSTEILFALGLGESVCGVTFECDYPAEARSKPVVVYSKLPPGLAEKEIDRQVNDFSSRDESLYRLDADRLREIQPDVIVTQDLCHVCAATPNDLGAVLSSFVHPPQVLALTPHNLEDIWKDIQTVGDACERSQEAKLLINSIKQQIAVLAPTPSNPPRVLCLEWLDPPFVGGHWVPEMVALAGGTDVLGKPDHPGVPVSWDAIVASDPDIILAIPCGYHRHEVEKELEIVPFPKAWYSLRAVRNGHVFAMDASSHFSRPGPRVIDGILELAELFRSYKRRSRKKVAQAIPVDFQSQVRQRR